MQLTDLSLSLETCSWVGRLLHLLYHLVTTACGPSQSGIRIKNVAGWVPQDADSKVEIIVQGQPWGLTSVEGREQREGPINPNKGFR